MPRRNRKSRRARRRTQKLADILGQLKSDVDDLKQKRPSAAAITKVFTVEEAGVGLQDFTSGTTVTNPVFTYDDADRGYDYSEYPDEYP